MLQYYPSRLLTQLVAPSVEPIALADAKLYLRVDITDDDTLITALITAARMHAEEYTRRSFITQTWQMAYDGGLLLTPFWRAPLMMRAPMIVRLPKGLVNSITSVTSYDQLGNTTTIDPSAYAMDAAQDSLVYYSPFLAQKVAIVYVTGYGAASTNVPQPLIDGMMAHIGAMYDQRGDASLELPVQSIALYAPYRDMRL